MKYKGLTLMVLMAFFLTSKVFSQEFTAGVKGGANFFKTLDFSDTGTLPDSDVGFHGGIFGQYNFSPVFFVRPEVEYSNITLHYELSRLDTSYKLDKISGAALFGAEIFNNFSIFAGPAYQHFFNKEYTAEVREPEIIINSWAIQFGVKYDITDWIGLSVKYDYTADSNKRQILSLRGDNGNVYNYSSDDGRVNQIFCSVYITLFNSSNRKAKRARSSGRGCYF